MTDSILPGLNGHFATDEFCRYLADNTTALLDRLRNIHDIAVEDDWEPPTESARTFARLILTHVWGYHFTNPNLSNEDLSWSVGGTRQGGVVIVLRLRANDKSLGIRVSPDGDRSSIAKARSGDPLGVSIVEAPQALRNYYGWLTRTE